MQGAARSWKRQGYGFSLRASRRSRPALLTTRLWPETDFGLRPFRALTEQIRVVLSHQACGSLLEQQQETTTPSKPDSSCNGRLSQPGSWSFGAQKLYINCSVTRFLWFPGHLCPFLPHTEGNMLPLSIPGLKTD